MHTKQPILRYRTAAVALLCLAALPRCTCADMRRNAAYNQSKEAAIKGHIHVGARSDIASDAVSLLGDRGYTAPAWDGTTELRTEWRGSGKKRRDRVHITVASASRGHRVLANVESQTLSDPKYKRKSRDTDAEFEAAVLERVTPGAGKTLSAKQISEHSYVTPSAELWEAIESEARSRGHYFATSDAPVDVTASSKWEVLEGEETSRVRYDVQIARVDPKHFKVQAHRTIEEPASLATWATTETIRDHGIEFSLIQMRSPEAAANIEAEASARGAEAYDKAMERRDYWCNAAESTAEEAGKHAPE